MSSLKVSKWTSHKPMSTSFIAQRARESALVRGYDLVVAKESMRCYTQALQWLFSQEPYCTAPSPGDDFGPKATTLTIELLVRFIHAHDPTNSVRVVYERFFGSPPSISRNLAGNPPRVRVVWDFIQEALFIQNDQKALKQVAKFWEFACNGFSQLVLSGGIRTDALNNTQSLFNGDITTMVMDITQQAKVNFERSLQESVKTTVFRKTLSKSLVQVSLDTDDAIFKAVQEYKQRMTVSVLNATRRLVDGVTDSTLDANKKLLATLGNGVDVPIRSLLLTDEILVDELQDGYVQFSNRLRSMASLRPYRGRSQIILRAPEKSDDELRLQYSSYIAFVRSMDERLQEQDSDTALRRLCHTSSDAFRLMVATLREFDYVPLLKDTTIGFEVLVFLVHTSQGISQRALSVIFQRGLTTINKIINRMIRFCCSRLWKHVIRLEGRPLLPSRHGFIDEEFLVGGLRRGGRIKQLGFVGALLGKGCIGAIDGLMINFEVGDPEKHADYYCFKNGGFAMNCPVGVSFDGFINFVHAGIEGSTNDDTALYRCVDSGSLNFQRWSDFFIGDGGYNTTNHMISPFLQAKSSHHIVDFLLRCQANRSPMNLTNLLLDVFRNVTERCYGRLREKFSILKKSLDLSPRAVTAMVYTLAVFFNLSWLADGSTFESDATDDFLTEEQRRGFSADTLDSYRNNMNDWNHTFFQEMPKYVADLEAGDDNSMFDWGGPLANRIVEDFEKCEKRATRALQKESERLSRRQSGALMDVLPLDFCKEFGVRRKWCLMVKIWYVFVTKIKPDLGYELYREDYYDGYDDIKEVIFGPDGSGY